MRKFISTLLFIAVVVGVFVATFGVAKHFASQVPKAEVAGSTKNYALDKLDVVGAVFKSPNEVVTVSKSPTSSKRTLTIANTDTGELVTQKGVDSGSSAVTVVDGKIYYLVNNDSSICVTDDFSACTSYSIGESGFDGLTYDSERKLLVASRGREILWLDPNDSFKVVDSRTAKTRNTVGDLEYVGGNVYGLTVDGRYVENINTGKVWDLGRSFGGLAWNGENLVGVTSGQENVKLVLE